MAITDITKPMALDETLQGTNDILATLGKDTSLQAIATALATLGLTSVGDLSQLTTEQKTSLVAAINEINGDLDNYVQKSDTPGLLKNDGTVDDTPYTVVESSTTNGNIVIDDVETPVYRNYGNNAVLITDKTPFLTRQTLNPTGFSGYVREKLVGASYAWNQLNDQNYYRTSANTTVSANAKNGFDASSTAQYIQVQTVYGGSNSLSPIYAGHKYLVRFEIEDISKITQAQLIAYGTTLTRLYYTPQKQNYLLIAPSVNGNSQFGFEMQFTMDTVDRSLSIANLVVSDLTIDFGSDMADKLYAIANNGGITLMRNAGFPIDKYTPYGYGLYSVKTSGKVVGSANLFDEEYPSLDSTIRYRGIYLGVGTYTMSSNASESSACALFFLDGNVSTGANNSTNGVDINHPRTVFSESGYVTVAYRISTVNPTNANTQIERGSTPTTYEKSWHTTYSLGNDELRGKFDLVNGEIVASGDVKESNGGITRVRGRQDLGQLTYSMSASNNIFYANVPNMVHTTGAANRNVGIISSKYPPSVSTSISGSMDDKSMLMDDGTIYIRDTSYSDATAFKNSLDGVYLEFPLATPTTEQSTPFADPMSLVGATTEEYIDTRDIPCPVGAERQYMGQSEDVVEIPSTPQSDGVWVQKCYVSGGKAHYVWELES